MHEYSGGSEYWTSPVFEWLPVATTYKLTLKIPSLNILIICFSRWTTTAAATAAATAGITTSQPNKIKVKKVRFAIRQAKLPSTVSATKQ